MEAIGYCLYAEQQGECVRLTLVSSRTQGSMYVPVEMAIFWCREERVYMVYSNIWPSKYHEMASAEQSKHTYLTPLRKCYFLPTTRFGWMVNVM